MPDFREFSDEIVKAALSRDPGDFNERILGDRSRGLMDILFPQKRFAQTRALRNEIIKAVIPMALEPTRDITLRQAAGLSGLDPELIASPDQYKVVRSETINPTLGFVPGQSPGPLAAPLRVLEPVTLGPVGPRPPVVAQELRPLQPETFTPTVGPTPSRAEGGGYMAIPFVNTKPPEPLAPGLPNTVTEARQLDLDQPANYFQQSIGASALEREKRWPRGGGSSAGGGSRSKGSQKVQYAEYLREHFGDDVADAYLLQGFVPGSAQERESSAKVARSEAQAEALRRGVELGKKKFESGEKARSWREKFKETEMSLKKELAKQRAAAKLSGDALALARVQALQQQHAGLFNYGLSKDPRFDEDERQAFLDAASETFGRMVRDPNDKEATSTWDKIMQTLGVKSAPAPVFQPQALPQQTPQGQVVDDTAELAEAAREALAQKMKPGASYRAKSGKVYKWTGKGFK